MSHFSVTVFCGSSLGQAPDYRVAAQALGSGLAARRMGMVFGGGNVGLMGTIAGASLQAGGTVTGIIPEFLRVREVPFDGLSELIITESMHDRKKIMFDRGDAFVVLPGGLGTLDELIEILTWKQLDRHTKPILLCDIRGWAQPVTALIDHVIGEGFARSGVRDLFEVLDGVEATLARLSTYAERPNPARTRQ